MRCKFRNLQALDCRWSNMGPSAPLMRPVSYHMQHYDHYGVVHLLGAQQRDLICCKTSEAELLRAFLLRSCDR